MTPIEKTFTLDKVELHETYAMLKMKATDKSTLNLEVTLDDGRRSAFNTYRVNIIDERLLHRALDTMVAGAEEEDEEDEHEDEEEDEEDEHEDEEAED